ncbi:putative HSP20-like chaperone [Helianthus anomalus]
MADKRFGVVIDVVVNLYDRLFYGYAKPEMKRNDQDEIVFEIPVQGVTKDEIRMFVNEKNVFVLESSNKERCYSHHVKLPTEVNFAKAVFKPVKLELGMVTVTVKNFKQKF